MVVAAGVVVVVVWGTVVGAAVAPQGTLGNSNARQEPLTDLQEGSFYRAEDQPGPFNKAASAAFSLQIVTCSCKQ